MDEHLELDIRKGYSEYYSEFKALSIWIEGLLEQLVFHDHLVYTFGVRVKTIESLLKKTIVRMDKEHKESFTCTCFNDVKKHIKDIVGARILVYVPDVLRKLHALITAMDSDLLIVKEIRIHYKEDKQFETNKTPDSERHDKAQKFLEKHERELAKIADVSTGNIDANIELGELLLKGGYYEKALELYEKCLAITERDGWVLLRLAETCDRLGKTDEALGYVRRLGRDTETKRNKRQNRKRRCFVSRVWIPSMEIRSFRFSRIMR